MYMYNDTCTCRYMYTITQVHVDRYTCTIIHVHVDILLYITHVHVMYM